MLTLFRIDGGLCYTDVGIGDVKAVPFNIVQAFGRIHTRRCFSIPLQFY